ncbi:sugar-binding transcriptional regulator [Paracoccus sp. IB05]|uniref:sugar-binding transcriptional regulator n=1 Tax=Paracoccus sp. IB05 TaxID=2779367 RepID=UPI0018E831A4|nr:sugar-binding transcriptional regulator [Paracoccus sp. IB05]MBJ2150292.1 sugar-binding transcriptional regulator [Paracoccus sp. IB05]
MNDDQIDYELARQIQMVLVLHFLEGMRQSEIATRLNLSTSKVNRLIAQGRRMGMVQIHISSPWQRLTDLEQRIVAVSSLKSAVVCPTLSEKPDTLLGEVGRAAATLLLENLRDGDVLAITGGKAISAVVEKLAPERALDVTVVPLTGGVQGKYYTDVNHLVSRMAEKLGGRAMLVHAPLLAENPTQREMLCGMHPVKEVFDLARGADVVVAGIGSIAPKGSSYYDLAPLSEAEGQMLVNLGIAAEFMAYLIGRSGSVADFAQNARLVAVHPSELATCRQVIGVATGLHKIDPIRAVLRGGFIDTLVIDERTVETIITTLEGERHVA